MAVLDRKQQREIEIYAGIEPIGWDVGVSKPKEKDEEKTDQVESKLDAILGQFPTVIKGPDKP